MIVVYLLLLLIMIILLISETTKVLILFIRKVDCQVNHLAWEQPLQKDKDQKVDCNKDGKELPSPRAAAVVPTQPFHQGQSCSFHHLLINLHKETKKQRNKETKRKKK
jgi:hypothetical protein